MKQMSLLLVDFSEVFLEFRRGLDLSVLFRCRFLVRFKDLDLEEVDFVCMD